MCLFMFISHMFQCCDAHYVVFVHVCEKNGGFYRVMCCTQVRCMILSVHCCRAVKTAERIELGREAAHGPCFTLGVQIFVKIKLAHYVAFSQTVKLADFSFFVVAQLSAQCDTELPTSFTELDHHYNGTRGQQFHILSQQKSYGVSL